MDRSTFVLGGIAVTAVAALLFAGPLDPPAGPVAPTFKTLTEVEPRIAINGTNTPGDSDATPSLFKITQPGSYYLTGNIAGVVGKHGIEIASNGVTLDLNGFDLMGIVSSLDGVSATLANLTNIAVVNGSVRNWGDKGVDLVSPNVTNCRIEGLLVSGNASTGIAAGTGSTVSNCAVRFSGSGISVSEGSSVMGCSVRSSNGIGIFASSNCTVSSCVVNDSSSNGILTSFGCTVSDCSVRSNTGNGISVGDGCFIRCCTVVSSTLAGIFTTANCSITGCNVTGSQSSGILAGPRCVILQSAVSGTSAGPGILATSEGLRIEGCSINNNSTFGVTVDTASNIAELAVVNCTIQSNGSAGISSEASTQVLDSVIASNASGMILTGSCLVRGCTINSNTDSGIELTGNANVVMNNTLSSNAVTLATSAGILVQGTDNTIDANRLFSNVQGGIKVNTSGNLVLRNYLARTGATITVVAGNAVAQTLLPGNGFISTDPNANLTY